ncbi:c-type cytochrome biogenesis protein CcmI [Swingsia samuiensis]|uniref:C-type cytochrome biogenesis protein CcmI n=1 Tax=Swingsia samuiensis TaxID=1293412 RepID=A0A4Y6UKU6_9PROT|nr:c-type cytochrome biogenesis protein CcmI [Swingsia samuiensis]QDH17258.1 c-type cytochrome biogenesis protein CcmI [Swingsia samuiensis]
MFLISIFIIIGLALLPVFYGWFHLQRHHINARTSALQLYQGQLKELDRDHSLDLINQTEYLSARLEVQRRLLAIDATSDQPDLSIAGPYRKRMGGLIVSALLIPAFSCALYIINGHPSLPPQPLSERQLLPDSKTMDMIHKLQAQVAMIPLDNPTYLPGHILLGQVEARAGMVTEAIKNWKIVLNTRFSPQLAIQIAELQSQKDGHISHESLELYRQALAASPPNASWRMALEARIAVGEHEESKGQ